MLYIDRIRLTKRTSPEASVHLRGSEGGHLLIGGHSKCLAALPSERPPLPTTVQDVVGWHLPGERWVKCLCTDEEYRKRRAGAIMFCSAFGAARACSRFMIECTVKAAEAAQEEVGETPLILTGVTGVGTVTTVTMMGKRLCPGTYTQSRRMLVPLVIYRVGNGCFRDNMHSSTVAGHAYHGPICSSLLDDSFASLAHYAHPLGQA